MEKAVEIVLLAVAVLIAVIVSALAMQLVNSGKGMFAVQTANLTAMTSQFGDPEKQTYDGLTIQGSQVISVIQQYVLTDQVAVYVRTNTPSGHPSGGWPFCGPNSAKYNIVYTGSAIDGAPEDIATGNYTIADVFQNSVIADQVVNSDGEYVKDGEATKIINPLGSFTGHVYYTTDNVVSLIEFVQN